MTDAVNNITASFHETWYRPIKFTGDDRLNFKFLIVVVHAFTVHLPVNFVNFWSDPLQFPIEFVNNNNYGVFNALNNPMNSNQALYHFLYDSSTNTFKFEVSAHNTPADEVINDSFFFIIQYF
jgi:hypothetical protein